MFKGYNCDYKLPQKEFFQKRGTACIDATERNKVKNVIMNIIVQERSK